MPGGTTESTYDDPTGWPAVALFSVAGMAHGLAVSPGSGADQCHSTGTYYLNHICSSYYTGKFWGLDDAPDDGDGSLPAPAGLTVTGTTGTGASLSWSAVNGAASYAVYRDGTRPAPRRSDVHRHRPERGHRLPLHGRRDRLLRRRGGC
ncbi:hypothetical protein ABDE16_25710 [Streptomyces sp. BRB040]|uniref:hypothetical protein n=1 Tax=Streptomyces sp. BRB040 TaxID=3142634 RepID=UPI0031F6038C